MLGLHSQDPAYDARIRASFGRQRIMSTIGATLMRLAPGEVEIGLPFRDDLVQQHGYVHGGIIAAIADSACGYAALTLSPPGTEVLTVEYKINFLAPARGDRFVARGRVVRTGRTISVCEGEVLVVSDGVDVRIATMLATMIQSAG